MKIFMLIEKVHQSEMGQDQTELFLHMHQQAGKLFVSLLTNQQHLAHTTISANSKTVI